MVLKNFDLNRHCFLDTSQSNMEDELLISEDVGEEFYNDMDNTPETSCPTDSRIENNEDFNEEELVVVDEVHCESERLVSSGNTSSRIRSSTSDLKSHIPSKRNRGSVENDRTTYDRRNKRIPASNNAHRKLFSSSTSIQHSSNNINFSRSHSSFHSLPLRRSNNYSKDHSDSSRSNNYYFGQDRDFRSSSSSLGSTRPVAYHGSSNPYNTQSLSSTVTKCSASSSHPKRTDYNTRHDHHSDSLRRDVKEIGVQGYDVINSYHFPTSLYDNYRENRHSHASSSTSNIKPLINPEELRRSLRKSRSDAPVDGKNDINSPKRSSNRLTPRKSNDDSNGRTPNKSRSSLASPRKLTDRRLSRSSNGNKSNSSTPKLLRSETQSTTVEVRPTSRKTRSPLVSPPRVKEAPLIDIKREPTSPTPENSTILSQIAKSESPVVMKHSKSKSSNSQLVGVNVKSEPTNKISEETFKQAEEMGIDVTYLLEYKANEAEIQRRRKEIELKKAESRRQRFLNNQNSAASVEKKPCDKSRNSDRSDSPFRPPQLPIRKVSNSPIKSVVDESPSPSPTKKRRAIHSLDVESASVVQNLSRNVTNIEAAEELRKTLTRSKTQSFYQSNEIRKFVQVSHLKPITGLKELESLVRLYFESASVQKVSGDTRVAVLEFQDDEEATDFVRRFNGFKLRESIIKVNLC